MGYRPAHIAIIDPQRRRHTHPTVRRVHTDVQMLDGLVGNLDVHAVDGDGGFSELINLVLPHRSAPHCQQAPSLSAFSA
jgi:hypothetical protein